MEKRKLGRNGPEISALGFGAMSFTNFYGPTTEQDSHAVLDLAIEAGVTHLDTANVYGMGRSEQVIGNFFKKVRNALFFTPLVKITGKKLFQFFGHPHQPRITAALLVRQVVHVVAEQPGLHQQQLCPEAGEGGEARQRQR